MSVSASMLELWSVALDQEDRVEDAIALLVDAAAFGLAQGDFDPSPIHWRLQESFDHLMIMKHGRMVQ